MVTWQPKLDALANEKNLNKNIRNRFESGKIITMEIRSIPRGIVKNHELANDLWTAPDTHPRMLDVLVMDRKQTSSDCLEARMGNIERRDSEGNLETE
jgi:3-methyladenine DNA glycosylase AlkD